MRGFGVSDVCVNNKEGLDVARSNASMMVYGAKQSTDGGMA